MIKFVADKIVAARHDRHKFLGKLAKDFGALLIKPFCWTATCA